MEGWRSAPIFCSMSIQFDYANILFSYIDFSLTLRTLLGVWQTSWVRPLCTEEVEGFKA